jgi:hypothetical protein
VRDDVELYELLSLRRMNWSSDGSSNAVEVNRGLNCCGTPEQGAPLFVGEIERGIFLFPSRPEERDSSLGGRYFNAKRDPPSIHRDFLGKFGEPRAAGAADGSLKWGHGCGQSRNKLLKVGASSV